jgi:N-acetylglutamate synthase-like GNAT family acetyltransferase
VRVSLDDDFQLDDDPSRLDIAFVWRELTNAYWSRGIPRELVERAIRSSRCFGVYREGEQVAFARVIGDMATFAYLCDVVVAERCRGRGLGKRLVAAILEQPGLADVRRVLLATKDAHGLYARFGFEDVPPHVFMERKKSDPYGAGS